MQPAISEQHLETHSTIIFFIDGPRGMLADFEEDAQMADGH